MHRSMSRLVMCSVPLVLSLLSTGCNDSKSNPVNPAGTLQESTDYTISGSNLVLSYPQTIEVNSTCNGNTMVVERDTSEASTDTIPFILSGNTLKVMFDQNLDTTGTSLAVIGFYFDFTRRSGSGLTGLWKLTSFSYQVISGGISAERRAELDSEIAAENAAFLTETGSMELLISGGKLAVYESSSSDAAQDFIDYWNGKNTGTPSYSDSARYNISVLKLSAMSVRLTGNVSHEVVTITLNENSVVYVSSLTTHAQHTYYENPTECPNETQPTWYTTFKTENARALAKKLVTSSYDSKKERFEGSKLFKSLRRLNNATILSGE